MFTARQKEIGIYALTILYSVCFFLLVQLFFQVAQWRAGLNLILIITGVLWVALVATAMAFTRQENKQNIWIPLTLSLVVPITSLFTIESFIGAAFMILLLFAAQRAIHQQIKERIRWTTAGIFIQGVRLLIFAILIGVVAIGLPFGVDLIEHGELRISEQYMQKVLRPFSPVIQNFFPEYSSDVTVNNIVEQQAGQQSRQSSYILSDSQRQQAVQQIAKQLKLPLEGHETIPQISAMYINRLLQNISTSVQEVSSVGGVFLTIAIIAIILLAIRATLPVFVWPALGLILLLVYGAERSGIVNHTQVNMPVDRYQL